MRIMLDEYIKGLVSFEFNIYRDCFYSFHNTAPFQHLDFCIVFNSFFTSKMPGVEPIKITIRHALSEKELRDLDVWIALNEPKPIIELVYNTMVTMINQVEQFADNLKGFEFDRQATEYLNSRTISTLNKATAAHDKMLNSLKS